jgi:hypothetical protein
VELDVVDFTKYAIEEGWGDGLPVVPPTEVRVREFLAASKRYPDEVICVLPPMDAECTVEKIAINAVMAGAPPESMPLLIATLEALAEPDFELFGMNATTAPVVPLMMVNGPIRDTLKVPYREGCMGGIATSAQAAARAIRLIMRNVAGQNIGTTSVSVFGSPGRVAGIIYGEWEERSPWAPLAERRGVKGNAVTVFGTNGTMNIVDSTCQKGIEFLEVIGRSAGYLGANGFSQAVPYSEVMFAINPVWAEIIGRDFPKIEDVQEIIWTFASLDQSVLMPKHKAALENLGRIHSNGRVYLADKPEHVIVSVAGGTGSLHTTAFHGYAPLLSQTKAITA